jgi:hypothetical protein
VVHPAQSLKAVHRVLKEELRFYQQVVQVVAPTLEMPLVEMEEAEGSDLVVVAVELAEPLAAREQVEMVETDLC